MTTKSTNAHYADTAHMNNHIKILCVIMNPVTIMVN